MITVKKPRHFESGAAAMLEIVSLLAVALFNPADGLKCYTFSSPPLNPNSTESPKLPPEATVQTCASGDTMCMKVYALTIERAGGMETFGTMYEWTCGHFENSHWTLGLKCGDRLELSHGEELDDGGSIFEYTRACTCCKDLCNDASMDDVCNEKPKFTHKCYAAESSAMSDDPTIVSNPNLPTANATQILCTSTQSCMKNGRIIAGSADYTWGCINTPEGKCGSSGYQVDNNNGDAEKVCTCCGDLCNGPAMDSILANNSDCKSAADLPSNSDNLVILIGAILGSLIAVTITGLGVAIFFVFRFRSMLEHNKSDRVHFVKEAESAEITQNP